MDMTSVWVAEQGWCYLHAAIDCCAVVGTCDSCFSGWSIRMTRIRKAISVAPERVPAQVLPGSMLTPVLTLCLLLNPHEISESPVDALTVSQLEYEDWRLDSPPALGGWISMLSAGIPLAEDQWLAVTT